MGALENHTYEMTEHPYSLHSIREADGDAEDRRCNDHHERPCTVSDDEEEQRHRRACRGRREEWEAGYYREKDVIIARAESDFLKDCYL